MVAVLGLVLGGSQSLPFQTYTLNYMSGDSGLSPSTSNILAYYLLLFKQYYVLLV